MQPHNILISREFRAKIADFGLAKILEGSDRNVLDSAGTYTANIGSPAYMAPELLTFDAGAACHGKGEQAECSRLSVHAHYSASVDMYSLGIIANALYCRAPPFDETKYIGVLHLLRSVQEGNRPTIPEACPPLLQNIMRRCWVARPEERATAEEVLRMFELEEAGDGEGDDGESGAEDLPRMSL